MRSPPSLARFSLVKVLSDKTVPGLRRGPLMNEL